MCAHVVCAHNGTLLLYSREVVSDSVTPRTAAHQASLSFTVSRSLLRFMCTESVMLSNQLILCYLFFCLVFPSTKAFSNGTLLSRKKKNEIMSFAATWIDLERVILIKVNHKEKDKYHMIPLVCGI